jgi:PPOX class probable F420-dependent enzyme
LNTVGFTSHDMAIQIEQRVMEFINAHRVARLATADAVGRPAVIPICYVFDGTSFYSAIDLKPKRPGPKELQRIRNIRVNPNVALVIDDYSENWSELAYVLVHGAAKILEPNESIPEQETAIAALRLKYEQYRSMPIHQNPLIKIVPDRVQLWSGASF